MKRPCSWPFKLTLQLDINYLSVLSTFKYHTSANQEKLAEQKSLVTEERKTVLEAVAKMGLAEKKFEAKIKEFEDVALVSEEVAAIGLSMMITDTSPVLSELYPTAQGEPALPEPQQEADGGQGGRGQGAQGAAGRSARE